MYSRHARLADHHETIYHCRELLPTALTRLSCIKLIYLTKKYSSIRTKNFFFAKVLLIFVVNRKKLLVFSAIAFCFKSTHVVMVDYSRVAAILTTC